MSIVADPALPSSPEGAATTTGRSRAGAGRRWLPGVYLTAPMLVLIVLFLVPMVILFLISIGLGIANQDNVWTFDHYTELFHDPLYWHVAKTTVVIATSAMVAQLIVGVPLAYIMAFKAGRWELPMVLGLVVLDGLNPVVRIYAWRILLGRNGIINGSLEWAGIIDKPIDALLFNNFAVIVVLSTSWITYTVIPIYASMKAIDSSLIEAATDLGAGWMRRAWKIILPLSAPGIFIAIILVYIPLYTEFATPTLVGGTGSYMLGQLNAELITETGDLGQGAALSALLLVASGVLAAVAYYLSRLNRLDT
jgi:ABC-type spermidine/putrescine transport system permease subunit I